MTSDQQAELRQQIAVLRQDAEDLRASATWWRRLYEEAVQRRAEAEARAAKNKALNT